MNNIENKCVCGEQECLGGAEVEIGGVCHRPNNPCYIIPANNTKNEVERIVEEFDYYMHKNFGKLPQEAYNKLHTTLTTLQSHHEDEVTKAREEERERIEAVFKKHVPPHGMSLEDSVWLKRLLNKVFQHEN